MPEIPKITLDANCVINLLDYATETATSVDFLTELIKHSHLGNISLAITTRVARDLEGDSDEVRKKEIIRRIGQFPIIGTIPRYNVTKYKSGDLYGGDRSKEIAEELKQIIFPGLSSEDKRFKNKINDVDHLLGHIVNSRDIFTTDDRGILKKKSTLKSSLGVVVMTPEECLEYIEKVASEKEERELVPSTPNEGYSSPALSGKVTFDYSNNNGRYSIGSGFFLFETKWSHASQDAIHAYSGSESVESIALAKKMTEIQDIKEISAYDFSSHSRTPNEGQIIILKNKNKIYAAIKVLDVKYEDRGEDDRDELTFIYFIQPNREFNFEDAPTIK